MIHEMIEKVKDFITLYRNLTQQQLVLSFNDLIDNANVCQYLLQLLTVINTNDKLEIVREILSIVLIIDSSIQSISVSPSIPLLINELNALISFISSLIFTPFTNGVLYAPLNILL